VGLIVGSNISEIVDCDVLQTRPIFVCPVDLNLHEAPFGEFPFIHWTSPPAPAQTICHRVVLPRYVLKIDTYVAGDYQLLDLDRKLL
jgi:hypothetical protein